MTSSRTPDGEALHAVQETRRMLKGREDENFHISSETALHLVYQCLDKAEAALSDGLVVETFDGEEPAVPCGISWIIHHHDGTLDHACALCVPGGANLIEGFVCYYHHALALKEGP